MKKDTYLKRAGLALGIIILLVLITLLVFLFSKQKSSAFEPDFGSLIGGSLGGIGTLIAVIFTLKANQVEAQVDRKTNVKPLLNVWHRNGADSKRDLDQICDVYDWVINNADSKIEKKTRFDIWLSQQSNVKPFSRQLVIQNIGLGSAVNITLQLHANNIVYSSSETFHLEKGQITLRNLIIPNVYNPENFTGDYSLVLNFFDILGNQYSQEINFQIVTDQTQHCGITLGDYIRTNISIEG